MPHRPAAIRIPAIALIVTVCVFSAHILDTAKSAYGKNYVNEVFLPIKLDFKVELEGKPLAGPDKIPWVQRQMNQPHDFGNPERTFPYGVPEALIRAE